MLRRYEVVSIYLDYAVPRQMAGTVALQERHLRGEEVRD